MYPAGLSDNKKPCPDFICICNMNEELIVSNHIYIHT